MHSIAILGFFSIVIFFFFAGRNDFGLKPTPQKNISKQEDINDEDLKLEGLNNQFFKILVVSIMIINKL